MVPDLKAAKVNRKNFLWHQCSHAHKTSIRVCKSYTSTGMTGKGADGWQNACTKSFQVIVGLLTNHKPIRLSGFVCLYIHLYSQRWRSAVCLAQLPHAWCSAHLDKVVQIWIANISRCMSLPHFCILGMQKQNKSLRSTFFSQPCPIFPCPNP